METTKSLITASDSTPAVAATVGELVLEISGNSARPETVRIRSPKCTIGSADACTIRLNSLGVHAVHCIILRGKDSTYVRRWADSACLNGRPFDDAELNVGDVLSFATIQIKVVADERTGATIDLNNKVVAAELRVEQLSQQTKLLNDRIRHLESGSSNLSSTTQNELLIRLARLQEEKQELERRITAQSIRHLDERRQWGCDLERVKAELARMVDRVPPDDGSATEEEIQRAKELERQRQQLQQERDAFEAEVLRVQAEATRLEAESLATAQEWHDVEQQRQQLQQERAAFEAEVLRVHEEAARLQAESVVTAQERRDVERRAEALQQRVAKFDLQRAELEAQQIALDNRQSEIESQLNLVQAQQAERNAELQQATVQLELAQKAAETEQRRAEQLRAEIAELEARCGELQHEMELRTSLINQTLPPPVEPRVDHVQDPNAHQDGPADPGGALPTELPSHPSPDDLMSYASQVANEVSSQVIDQQATATDKHSVQESVTADTSSPFDSHFIDLVEDQSSASPLAQPADSERERSEPDSGYEPIAPTSAFESQFIDREQPELGRAAASSGPIHEDGQPTSAVDSEYGPTSDQQASPFESEFIDLEDEAAEDGMPHSEWTQDSQLERPADSDYESNPEPVEESSFPFESHFIDVDEEGQEATPQSKLEGDFPHAPVADSDYEPNPESVEESSSPFESQYIDLDDEGQEVIPQSELEGDSPHAPVADADYEPNSESVEESSFPSESHFIDVDDAGQEVIPQSELEGDSPHAPVADADYEPNSESVEESSFPFESHFIDVDEEGQEATPQSELDGDFPHAPVADSDYEPNSESVEESSFPFESHFIDVDEGGAESSQPSELEGEAPQTPVADSDYEPNCQADEEFTSPFHTQYIDLDHEGGEVASEFEGEYPQSPVADSDYEPDSESVEESSFPFESHYIDLDEEGGEETTDPSELEREAPQTPAGDSNFEPYFKGVDEFASPFETQFIDLDPKGGEEPSEFDEEDPQVPEADSGYEPYSEAGEESSSPFESQYIDLDDEAEDEGTHSQLSELEADSLQSSVADSDDEPHEATAADHQSPFESVFIHVDDDATANPERLAEPTAPCGAADTQDQATYESDFDDPAAAGESQFIELEPEDTGDVAAIFDEALDHTPAIMTAAEEGQPTATDAERPWVEAPVDESLPFESQFIELEDEPSGDVVAESAEPPPADASAARDSEEDAVRGFPSELFPEERRTEETGATPPDAAHAFKSRLGLSDSLDDESDAVTENPADESGDDDPSPLDHLALEDEDELDLQVEQILAAGRNGLPETGCESDSDIGPCSEDAFEEPSATADEMLARLQAAVERDTGHVPADEQDADFFATEPFASPEAGGDEVPGEELDPSGEPTMAEDVFGQPVDDEFHEPSSQEDWGAAGEAEFDSQPPTTPDEIRYESVEPEDPGQLQTASLLEQFGIQDDVSYDPEPSPPTELELSTPAESASADDSIEDYMQQLLQRVGANPPASQVTPVAAELPSEVIETTQEPANVPPVQLPKRAPSRNVVAVDNLAAMRELANESARSAINRHAHSSQRATTFANLCICAIAGLVAAIFFVLANGNIGLWLALSVVAALVALFFGYKTGIACLLQHKSTGQRKAPSTELPKNTPEAIDPGAPSLDANQPNLNVTQPIPGIMQSAAASLASSLADPRSQPPADAALAPTENSALPTDPNLALGDLNAQPAAPDHALDQLPDAQHSAYNPEGPATQYPPFDQAQSTQYPPFHQEPAAQHPPFTDSFPGTGPTTPQGS